MVLYGCVDYERWKQKRDSGKSHHKNMTVSAPQLLLPNNIIVDKQKKSFIK